MRNISISIIISAFVVLIQSCAPTIYKPLRWQAEKLNIDGQSNDWPSPLRFYDSGSKLSYELCNDSSNLYLALRVTDRRTMMKIRHRGIQFAIDTATGHARYATQCSFPYHGRYEIDPFAGDAELLDDPLTQSSDGTVLQESRKPNQLSEGEERTPQLPITMLIKKFKDIPLADSVLSFPNNYGIEMAMNNNPDELFCELKIPFASFYRSHLSAKDTINPLFFQFHLAAGGDHRPAGGTGQAPHVNLGGMNGGGMRSGGGMHGGSMGGGGMRGGGMHGGGMGGDQSPQRGIGDESNADKVIRFQMRPSYRIQ